MGKRQANNQEPETIDLSSFLSREVKVDVPNAVIVDEAVQEVEFEDFAENSNENEFVNPENGKQPQQPNTDPGYQESGEVFMSNADLAENIVNLLDGLQSSVIPYLREKKIFTDKDLETLAKIDKAASYDPGSKEFIVLEKWKRHQDIIKTIPFDEGESRRLKSATARYAETTNMQVTPLQGLLMAYSEVAIKRVSVFMSE